ncbi:secondary thiamine-phosphate synthase enzyme YjbQ [Camelimonas sp. ID_303_24]
MPHVQHRLTLATKGQGFYEFTREVAGFVREASANRNLSCGLLTLFCRHTSASLLIQENADPDVQTDLLTFFRHIAPEGRGLYVHDSEGPDDMPAHIRTALTQTHLCVPVADGRMLLGTWQGIYLFEHRRAPHRREIVLHLSGD